MLQTHPESHGELMVSLVSWTSPELPGSVLHPGSGGGGELQYSPSSNPQAAVHLSFCMLSTCIVSDLKSQCRGTVLYTQSALVCSHACARAWLCSWWHAPS